MKIKDRIGGNEILNILLNSSFDDAAKKLKEFGDKQPPDAIIVMDSYGNDGAFDLLIEFSREETPSEKENRLKAAAEKSEEKKRLAKSVEALERAELARLKKKFKD